MTETPSPTETPFWQFSLHFYRQAKVSDACIALQDDCGVDVNLLLFLFWLAAGGRQLSAAEVERLDEAVRSWRDLTVVPIRDVRRKLKGSVTLVHPQKQEAFRTKIKAVELEAERLQQEALYGLTRSGPLGSEAAPRAAARANVAAYERVLKASFPKSTVNVLVGAFDAVEHGDFAAQ
ncbi:MAG TPA: TIGR02444 family protein [Xanthobacteraceae bacterium]|nr:TIGR02444 family protein [Xanthobacteraceae bacterium]